MIVKSSIHIKEPEVKPNGGGGTISNGHLGDGSDEVQLFEVISPNWPVPRGQVWIPSHGQETNHIC